MRILVIEDDTKIASFIIKGLKEAGFTVDHAEDGITGEEMAVSGLYDAAVVDIMLPYRDGLSIIKTLRRKNLQLPVIILSAKRSVEDRVKGLTTGSDDYLVKPFSFSELLARLQALLRRTMQTENYGVLSVGELSIWPNWNTANPSKFIKNTTMTSLKLFLKRFPTGLSSRQAWEMIPATTDSTNSGRHLPLSCFQWHCSVLSGASC